MIVISSNIKTVNYIHSLSIILISENSSQKYKKTAKKYKLEEMSLRIRAI